MPAATTSVNGYLTSTDWNTFNNKSNTNGTVTSVVALTIGTTGIDITSTAVTTTTTPVITLNIPTASASNRGALSSTDWTIFNNKQATLSLTTTGTSGAATLVANTLNIPQYSGGTITLSAIGSTPNANAATLTGSALNLEPASASFGGIVTTGTQTFAGLKTFNGNIGIGFAAQSNIGLFAYKNSTTDFAFVAQQDGVGPVAQFSGGSGASYLKVLSTGYIYFGTLPSSTTYVKYNFNVGTNQQIGFRSNGGIATLETTNDAVGANVPMQFSASQYIFGSGGNVQMGSTTDAGYRLDVSGTFRTTGIATFSSSTVSTTTSNGALIVTGGVGIGGEVNIAGTTTFGVSASGNSKFYIYGGFSAGLNLLQNYSGSAYTTEEHRASDYNFKIGTNTSLILNASGNVGLGGAVVTWNDAQINALQIKSSSIFGYSTTELGLVQNAVFNAGWKYINTATATYQTAQGGAHVFYNAVSGTAGAAITWVERFNINASGNIGIGTGTIGSTLQVNGNAAIGYSASTAASSNGLKVNGRGNFLNATDNALFSLNSGGTLYTVGFSPTATANSSTTLTITTAQTSWYYTGTGTATWTLPNPSGTNQMFWIKNAGTGIITLNAYAGTNIIDNTGSSVSSITIAIGATALIQQDGNVKSYQLQ